MKKRLFVFGVYLMLVMLLISGCGTMIATPVSSATQETDVVGPPTPSDAIIGMPNPASVYCEEQDGTVDMRTSDAGQVGVCIFPDGSECDEWAFFRGECQPGPKEESAEQIIGMPNPASVYCEEQGGTVDMRTSDAGQVGVCTFPDGSECDEWAFFRGECASGSPAPKLVFGWYGVVVTPPANQPFENYLLLMPKEAGNTGLMTNDPAVRSQLDALRDTGKFAHFWGALVCEDTGFNKETEFGGCVLDVTRLRIDGPGDFFAPDPVEGWEGVLVSLPNEPGSGGDDAFVLVAPVFKVRYGLQATDASIAAQLDALRNQPTSFYVWGELNCGVMDVNGCQIIVTRIAAGNPVLMEPVVPQVETRTETVEDWVGVVVSNPSGSQFDDYFQMMDQNGTRVGISGYGDIDTQLTALRDTGTFIHVWGIIRYNAPDAYGSQIEVSRIEIE